MKNLLEANLAMCNRGPKMHLFFNSAIPFSGIYSKGTFKLQRSQYSRQEAKAGISGHLHRENRPSRHRSNTSKLICLFLFLLFSLLPFSLLPFVFLPLFPYPSLLLSSLLINPSGCQTSGGNPSFGHG